MKNIDRKILFEYHTKYQNGCRTILSEFSLINSDDKEKNNLLIEHINKYLATDLFPFFVNVFIHHKKISFIPKENNRYAVKHDMDGYTTTEHPTIGDFLSQNTGGFIISPSIKLATKKTFKDELDKSLYLILDQKIKEFNIATNSPNVLISNIIELVYNEIKIMPIEKIATLYQLPTEIKKWALVEEKTKNIEKENKMIHKIISNLKNSIDKEIIIEYKINYQVHITKDNEIINQHEQPCEMIFIDLLKNMLRNNEDFSSIIIKEKTNLFSKKKERQYKIYGAVVKKDFLLILSKEKLQNLYGRAIEKDSYHLKNKNNFHFVNWQI